MTLLCIQLLGSSCWCIAQGVCATSKLSPNYSPSEDDTHVLHLNYGDGICAALRWCDRRGVCKELQQPSTSSEEEEDTNDICRQPEYKCKILEVSGRRRYCGRFRCEADLDEELEFCEECRSQRRGKCLREPGLTRCVYKKPRSRKKSEEERKREEERKKEEDRKKKEIN